MSKLILTISQQETQLAWAAARVGMDGPWTNDARAMAAVDSGTGKISAVLIANSFVDDTAVVHFASDGARAFGSRDIITGWFAYLFEFLKLRQVIGFTPSENRLMLKLLLQAGFHIEGRIRRSPDGSQQDIITSMFASECPWLQEKDTDHGEG